MRIGGVIGLRLANRAAASEIAARGGLIGAGAANRLFHECGSIPPEEIADLADHEEGQPHHKIEEQPEAHHQVYKRDFNEKGFRLAATGNGV